MALPTTQKSSAIKAWICVVLIIATTVFAFLPIVSIDLDPEMTSNVRKFASDKLGVSGMYELPDKAQISSISVISSINIIVKSVKVIVKHTPENEEALKNAIFESDGYTLKSGAAKTLALLGASFNAMGISGDDEDSGVAKTATAILTGIAILYVLLFVLGAPFIMLVVAISALIRIARAHGEYEVPATNLGASILDKLKYPVMLLIFQCLIPGFGFAIGGIGILVCTILGFCVCFAFTRMRKYPAEDGKYVNILQFCSLGALVGYALFLIFITRTGATRSFLTGSWPMAMKYTIDAGSVDVMYIIEGVLMLFAASFVLTSVKIAFRSNVRRITFSNDPAKKGRANVKNPEALLGPSIFMLVIPLIPLIISFIKNDPADESFLQLASSQTVALILAAVGVVIMIASEIVLIKLKPKLVPSVTPDRVIEIISGQSKIDKDAAPVAASVAAPAQNAAKAADEVPAAAEQPAAEPEQPAEQDNAGEAQE